MNLSGMIQKIQEKLWREKWEEETVKRARQLVCEKLADGRLQRHVATLRLPVETPASPEACAVCYGIKTDLRYTLGTGSLSFHTLCHAIWKEESAKPVKRT